MSWSNLPTDYADATWEGERKYTINLGNGGTYQNSTITDETSYSPSTSGGNYFYGANDANQTNNAINKIVTALGNDIDNLSVGIAYGGTGATTASGARTNLEVLKIYKLWTGSSTGTITLNESIKNYEFITVVFQSNNDLQNSVTFVPNFQNNYDLNPIMIQPAANFDSSGNEFYLKSSVITVTATTFTRQVTYEMAQKTNGNRVYTTGSQYIRIKAILGYKY